MIKYGSIFNRLEEVQIGDIFNITDLHGHQYTYFVDETSDSYTSGDDELHKRRYYGYKTGDSCYLRLHR